jgi:carbamoyl-phosphate synthase small subunit
MSIRDAAIVLSDGTVFEGEAIGAEPSDGVTTGEFVFNTVLSGYQEVISDPSYSGQVITFTYPHIGNYGVNDHDDESSRPRCAGVVIRDLARRHSSWRAESGLEQYLVRHGVAGIAGVDTRRLTRHLRDHGALPGAFGTADEATLRAAGLAAVGTDGRDLVAAVSTGSVYSTPSTSGADRRIVALDLGIKTTIVRNLAEIGSVEVVPASTSAADILAMDPDGVSVQRPVTRCGRAVPAPSGACSARCRCSASAWVTRCWRPRWVGRPTSCPSATTAATTRCAT